MTTDTATTETNVKIENAASNAALALKGRVTRATHLKAGTAYIMREWHKEPVYSEIVFIGFGKDINALVESIPQLKGLTNEDKFFIRQGENTLVAYGHEACVFLGEGDAAVRVTFSSLIGAEPEVKAEPAPKAPRKARKAKTEAAPAAEAPVEAAAETVIEAPAETVEA